MSQTMEPVATGITKCTPGEEGIESENGSSQDLPRNGLPNGLIDDRSIGFVALFLAGFRASQGPTFSLNMQHVRNQFGIGATAFKRGIRELNASGWYHRYQPRRGGKHQFAVDRIEPQTKGRPGYLISEADWFTRVIEVDDDQQKQDMVKATAVWLYMRSHIAGLPVGQDRIAARFDVTRQTASKLLKGLEHASLIWRIGPERVAGQFTKSEFTAHMPNPAMLKQPTAVAPSTNGVMTHTELGYTSTSIHPNQNYQITASTALPSFEQDVVQEDLVDPDLWIGTHAHFDVTDASEFERAAAVPLDPKGVDLLKSLGAVKRLKQETGDRIHRKLLTLEGMKGFWTLVNFVHHRHGWLTQKEVVDHVIDVTGRVVHRVDNWLNGWALIGIELDAADPAFRKGQPSWLWYLHDRAESIGASAHFGYALLRDRDGLHNFQQAFDCNQKAIDAAFDTGLRALQAKSEREDDGTWSASRWSWFENCHRWQQTRDQLTADIPDDIRKRRMGDAMWNDLEGFAEFFGAAGKDHAAHHAIVQGLQSLQDEGRYATRWSFFARYLKVAAA